MGAKRRRRPNAGEGYGFMFHGAFKEKKDAVAKERKTPGSFVRGTFTKQGHRYLVMSPLRNPGPTQLNFPVRVSSAAAKKISHWLDRHFRRKR